MRVIVFLLLSFYLHAVVSQTLKRPSNFDNEVDSLLMKMATANGYGAGQFHRCHIVPWKFIADMYDKLGNSNMIKFIDDLAKIHKDASFYDALDKGTQDTLDEVTNDYLLRAKEHLENGNTAELAKDLYNLPSNLYPGNPSNNLSIQGNLDPPRKGQKLLGQMRPQTKQRHCMRNTKHINWVYEVIRIYLETKRKVLTSLPVQLKITSQ